jgi:hypothetical protein
MIVWYGIPGSRDFSYQRLSELCLSVTGRQSIITSSSAVAAAFWSGSGQRDHGRLQAPSGSESITTSHIHVNVKLCDNAC